MKKIVLLAVMLSGGVLAQNYHWSFHGHHYVDQHLYRNSSNVAFKFLLNCENRRFCYKVGYVYHHRHHGEKFVSFVYKF